MYMKKSIDPEELRSLRNRLALSQSALADEVGVQANTVARWERGEIPIPIAVSRLIHFMAAAGSTVSAVSSSGVNGRDPHHAAILVALNGPLNGEAFEACAADLLKSQWKTLVPVRGGSDDGFDGAVGTDQGRPFPLIATTAASATANLRRNLKSAIANGWQPSAAIFATPRRITPRTRNSLHKAAEELGVQLAQIYDQDWFANALYRDSAWCKKLLNVTGRPSALSIIPASTRPVLGQNVIGRDGELAALRDCKQDCLVIGAPGSGKTFLLRALALEGRALFLNDRNRETLADAIRSQQPDAIIADDVHVDPATLTELQQLRQELRATFKIIAVSWPAEIENIKQRLHIAPTNVVNLKLIDADTMVEIIKAAGVYGPNALIATIVRQAEGRPGLAVTLAHLCLQGNTREVVWGDAIFEMLAPVSSALVKRNVTPLLAAFSLAGSAGCPLEVVAQFLNEPISDVNSALANLSTAGIIREDRNRAVSVHPEHLRWVLVKRVFFGGRGSPDFLPLFNALQNKADALLTLIGARSRGASVPHLERLLGLCGDQFLWRQYASLGASETAYVLKQHPELTVALVREALEFHPRKILPELLNRAKGDNRSLHSNPDHPLRKIQDWVTARPPSGSSVTLERRRILLSVVRSFWENGKKDQNLDGACEVAVRAFTIAFSATWQSSEADPGRGRTISFSRGVLNETETLGIKDLWISNSDLVREFSTFGRVSDIFHLIHEWVYNVGNVQIGEELQKLRLALVSVIIIDLAHATREHPGIQSRLARLASKRNIEFEFAKESEFEALFPADRFVHDPNNQAQISQKLEQFRDRWLTKNPSEFAKRLSQLEQEAKIADINYPRFSPVLCGLLAREVADPIAWAHALIDIEVSPDLVEPFLNSAARTISPQFEELTVRCLSASAYRVLAVGVLITMENAPSKLLTEAIKAVASFPMLVETKCLRQEVPAEILRTFLMAENPQVSLRAAIGEWCSDRRKSVGVYFLREWKQAIVRAAALQDLSESDIYWLGEIFEAHPDLAYEWLKFLISQSNDVVGFHQLELAEKSVAALDQAQRIAIMGLITPGHSFADLLPKLVGDDDTVYRKLLNSDTLSYYHLRPLQGPPDDAAKWATKAALALAKGYSEEEIAQAAYPQSWSWSGPESSMWVSWKEAFLPLTTHQNAQIRNIATLFAQRMDHHIERCLAEERDEAIFPR